MEDIDELLISHNELTIVCKAMFALILEKELFPELETKLMEAQVQPGFAERADKIEDGFKHRRRMLIAVGRVN